MTDLSATQGASRAWGKIALRWGLYVLLGLFALYYLVPLFVMVTTSLKSLDEIRSGSLIALPREVTFDAWAKAWSGACTGIQCDQSTIVGGSKNSILTARGRLRSLLLGQ